MERRYSKKKKKKKNSQENNGQRDRRMTISTMYIGNIETTTFICKSLYTSLDIPIKFPNFTYALNKHICKRGSLRLESVEQKSKDGKIFFSFDDTFLKFVAFNAHFFFGIYIFFNFLLHSYHCRVGNSVAWNQPTLTPS